MILLLCCGSVAGVPVENELLQSRSGESEGFGGGKSLQQSFESAGELGLMLVDHGYQFYCGASALALGQASELVGFLRFGWKEFALHVQIANASGSATELTEQPGRLFCLFGMTGKIGQ